MKTKLLIGILTLFLSVSIFSQNSGLWTASGSGASTTWNSNAGGVSITASATNYGSGTSFTLNDFVTYDTMGCAGAYSEPTIGGNPSLSVRHTFPNTAEITIDFSKFVVNPVLHLDRLGGGQVNNLTSSSLITIVTPGITFTELSENDVHFITTATTVGREASQTYTGLPSECGPASNGTASGSVRLNGIFNTITFEISMDASWSSSATAINDRWELAFSDVVAVDPHIDFDGTDDYLSTPKFIEGSDQVSIMAWIKIDENATTNSSTTIVGEDVACRLWLKDGIKPRFSITTEGKPTRTVWGGTIAKNQWTHLAGTYSNTTGLLKIYVNGRLESTFSGGITTGHIESSTTSTNTFEIGRASRDISNKEYFHGAIDEVRVFNNTLTKDQIQRMVHQEIEENSGYVRGSVIPKDIKDIVLDTKILWSDLSLYYRMGTTFTDDDRVIDYSGNERHALTYNITSWQEETAPMPYVSNADGDWTTENTWLHGKVWDIETQTTDRDWSIVQINSNVESSNSHALLGLIIEDNSSLSVATDNEINNKWYLDLKGTLDLEGDSQLVQTEYSDLVSSANGKLLRRQKGSSNAYWYTYMSSPVGQLSATTIGNDNSNNNNLNNSSFYLGMHKEGNGDDIEFTSAYNEVGKLSTRWTYSFLNGITYYDWLPLSPSTTIAPGVGYIHKGLGNTGLNQEYLFEGRPNNGTIKIAANDVDGDSGNESEPDVTQTTTLIGNPYPSAIDAHKFIDDNAGVIDGTLYFWHQWAGSSHNLAEYEGGYAIVNKMAKIRAYQFVGLSGENNGSQDGTLTPTQYISVGQSFMTEVIADGDIEFNNKQRVFKRESAGETQHFKNNKPLVIGSEKPMQIIKLEFKTSTNLSREIAIGFSDFTSSNFDYGYDGKMFADKQEDIYTYFNEQRMVTQAYGAITAKTVVPLGLSASGEYKYSIRLSDVENLGNKNVYLIDRYENTIFNLSSKENYNFKSASGEFNDRFEIVFEEKQKSDTKKSNVVNSDYEYNLMYYDNDSRKLFVKSLTEDVEVLELINMLGQTVKKFDNIVSSTLDNGLSISNISSGTYIVYFKTASTTKTKKIIID